MARPTTSRRTRRARVRSSEQNNVTGVYAPSYAQGDSEWGRAAQELGGAMGNALDAGTQLHSELWKAGLAEGEQAYLEGAQLEESEKSKSFRAGYMRSKARADLVRDSAELSDWYLNDVDKGASPEEVEALVEQRFNERYGNLQADDMGDPGTALIIGRGWDKMRESLIAKHIETQAQETMAEHEANVRTTLEAAYQNDGMIDAEEFNEANEALHATHGAKGNAVIVSTVIDMAVREGRPDLIDAIPEKWPNGAPGPAKRQEYVAQLRNARIHAESVRRQKEAEVQSELDAEREAQSEQYQRQAFLAGARGDSEAALQIISEAVTQGYMTAPEGRAALNFAQSETRSTGNTEPNVNALAEVRWRIATDPTQLSMGQLRELYQGGAFGDPSTPEALTTFDRLMGDLQSAKRGLSNDPEIKAVRNELKATTKPRRDPLDPLQSLPEDQAMQAAAMRAFDQAVQDGATPEQAMDAARQTYEEAGGEWHRKAEPEQVTPGLAARQLQDGSMSPRQFRNEVTRNGWSLTDAYQALRAAGFSAEDAIELTR